MIYTSFHSVSKNINNFNYNKWIKNIPDNKIIDFDLYDNKSNFIKIGKFIIDNEEKRNTVIKFIPCIPKKEYLEKTEWIYLFTINNKIVKIGGTRTGIKNRISSYMCGHHIPERKKSGFCSKTNGLIYNTFDFYLQMDFNINMYGYKIPKHNLNLNILNKEYSIQPQTYHIYESIFIKDFQKSYGFKPYLSNNCDPTY